MVYLLIFAKNLTMSDNVDVMFMEIIFHIVNTTQTKLTF